MTTPIEQLTGAVAVLFKELQKRGVVLTGEADPRDLGGTVAPVGAQYIQTSGGVQISRWQKFGIGDTDWSEILSAGGGGTIAPVVVSGNQTASASWLERPVHITAAAVITLPDTIGSPMTYDAPDGYNFNLCCETSAVGVSIVREDGGVIKTILGDLTDVGFSFQNGWISITYRNGNWYAVGQLVDQSP